MGYASPGYGPQISVSEGPVPTVYTTDLDAIEIPNTELSGPGFWVKAKNSTLTVTGEGGTELDVDGTTEVVFAPLRSAFFEPNGTSYILMGGQGVPEDPPIVASGYYGVLDLPAGAPTLAISMNETVGTAAANSVPGGSGGVISGGVTLGVAGGASASEDAGTAFSFDGTGQIIVANAAVIEPGVGESFTAFCWIKCTGTAGANNYVVMGSYDGTDGWWLVVSSNANKVRASLLPVTGSNFTEYHDGAGDLKSATVWSLVAIRFDNTNDLGAVFVNNVKEVGASFTGDNLTTGGDFVIAGQLNGIFNPFVGQMQWATFYPRALSDSEMTAIYSGGPK